MSVDYLKIRRPDDFHVHLREGDILKTVLPFTSSVMGKALIMPNLKRVGILFWALYLKLLMDCTISQ